MKRWLGEHGPGLAIAGVAVIAVGALITALGYSGVDGEPYSPLNHTVSELGERGVSELALVFDASFVAGGTLIALFMLSLVFSATTGAERFFGMLGVLTGTAVILVGLFPVDDFDRHKVAAILAFLSLTVTAGWFTVWTAIRRPDQPRWLGILSAWVVVAMIGFLLLPTLLQPDYTFQVEFDPDPPPRPDIWLAALLEWVVISSALIWIALLAWSKQRQRS